MGKGIDINAEAMKKHDTLACIFCGAELKSTTNYYPSASRNAIARADSKGVTRMLICKTCTQQLFEILVKLMKTRKRALLVFCSSMDIYYKDEIADGIQANSSKEYIEQYFSILESKKEYSGLTFLNSFNEKHNIYDDSTEGSDKVTLDKEDQKNRREIFSLFHYDPFEKEPITLRKKLYRDLVTMVDPAMVDDLVRQRAAIEIVRSFARIDEWTEIINEYTKDPQKMVKNAKDIKMLIDTKNKEVDMVTKFSKDHGFAERYALAKSRGAGTLSATIRDMEEYDYDDGKVNLYDIQTSATMQQAADISAQAIMKQLNLSEADYITMLKTQREALVEAQQELARVKEELRLVYKQITKQELLKELVQELKNKGMARDEIAKSILAEINYNDKEIKELKEKEEGAE